MPTTQDYSGTLRFLDFYTLDTATVDTGADLILFWDATDGALKRGNPPTGGGGVSDGDKGDISVTSSGTVWTIDNGAVTLAKMANMATDSFIGRDTAGTGAPEVLSAATARSVLGLATIATSASATDLTTGTVAIARIPTGTSSSTVCIGDDSRLSNNRTADAIYETGGPTTLTVGAVADGHFLKRSGSTAIGAAVTQGDVKFSDSPNDTVNVNVTVSPAVLVSKSLTATARDVIEVELWGTLLNNSGAVRTYTPRVTWTVGANVLTLTPSDSATVAASATARMWWRIKAWITVATTSATQGLAESYRASASVAANTAASPATSSIRHVWNTSSSDLTGSGTLVVDFKSDNTTATQQFTVYGYRISQRPQAI